MYRSIAADLRVDILVIFAEGGAEPRFDSGFGRMVTWQNDLLEGFPHTMIRCAESQRTNAILRELRKFNPNVVYVHGYATGYLRQAIRWANQSGIPVLMTTDSELRHPRPWHIRLSKQFLLPRILRKVDLFLTVGDENERYFRHYGITPDRFYRVPFSIDSPFYDQILTNRAEVRTSLRQRLSIAPEAVVILTVGKMIPRKEHACLIRAFATAIKGGDGSAVLVIAGDGPLRPHLEELAKPLGGAVRLPGFVAVEQLPEYYSIADIYVHPSSNDPHPLAISEALYCGLPAIVSDRVGSTGATDDVQIGRNGWVFPNGDEDQLSQILVSLIDHPELRAQASRHSRELGLLHSAEYCASRFIEGAILAVARRAVRGVNANQQ